MKKWLAIFGILGFYFLSARPAAAQITPRYELGGAFAYLDYSPPTYSRFSLIGGNVTFERNFKSYASLLVDGAAVFKDQGIVTQGSPPVATIFGKTQIYTILGGPRIYPLKHRHRLTPFGQILFGAGYDRRIFPANGGFPSLTNTSWSFSWMGGGGVDYRLSQHWAVHAFEFDYLHTSFFGGNPSQGSYRISVGMTYRWGRRTAPAPAPAPVPAPAPAAPTR
jgi:opacity protein-like surface antigen